MSLIRLDAVDLTTKNTRRSIWSVLTARFPGEWRTRDRTIISDLVTMPAAQQRDTLATVTVQRADYTIRARAKVSPQALRDLVRRIP